MRKLILVIRFGSLGDVILTSPAVLNLSIQYPDAHLVYLTKERFRPIVETFDGVDEVVAISDHASLGELLSHIMQLEDRGVDTVLDLHGNMRSWLTRRFVTANIKAVYPKRRLERLLAVRRRGKVIPPEYPHTIELYNTAVRETGTETPAERPIMPITAPPGDLAAWLDGSEPVVALAPGAAYPNKQWPLERFVETGRLLREQHRAKLIWLATDTDAQRPELAIESEDPLTKMLIDRPIPELASVLARCSVAISNDSGIGHLSSAVGTPVVSIFGPTHPVLGFAPQGLHDRVMEVDEPCRPCSLHGDTPCFREERFCFTRVTAGEVAESVSEIIESGVRRRRALIVDRDGTLIVNKHYLSDPEGVELIPGAVDALRRASESGFRIVIISNQSGVGRGYFSVEAVDRVNARVVELLQRGHVEPDGVYFCPHYPRGPRGNPFASVCRCRKPAPGMAEAAALELGMDLRRSVVIGDTQADIDLARVIGASAILVRTGYGRELEAKLTDSIRRRCRVADHLSAAVKDLL